MCYYPKFHFIALLATLKSSHELGKVENTNLAKIEAEIVKAKVLQAKFG